METDPLNEALSLIRRLIVTSLPTRSAEEHESAQADALDFLKEHDTAHAERPLDGGSDAC